jgi:hypothetical protein
MKLELCGWGIRGGRYFVGGAPGVLIEWYWYIGILYRWKGWWKQRYFYFGKAHPCNTGPLAAEWRSKCDAWLREFGQ